jgi:dephospho-CoA kinase
MTHVSTIIGFVGLTGAGKSTGANILINEFGFWPIRPGDFVHREVKSMHLHETPENERKAQVAIRERHGMDALAKLIAPQLREESLSIRRILLDSMCSYSERSFLISAFPEHKIFVVAFHAPLKQRQNQLAIRMHRPLTVEQMNERDSLEIDRLEKGKLISLADYHVVNGGDVHELGENVRRLVDLILST